MKRILKSVTPLIIAAIMTASFSACSKVDDNNGEQTVRNGEKSTSSGNNNSGNKVLSGEIASKEHVYKAQTISLPEGIDYPNKAIYSGGKLFIFGSNTFSEGEGENIQWYVEARLQVIALDGKLENENILFSTKDSMDSYRNFNSILVLKSGDIISVESGSSDYIVKYSGENGSKISEASLENLSKSLGGNHFTVDSIAEAADGSILISSGGTILITNDSGDIFGTMSKNSADTYLIGLLQTNDGKVFAQYGIVNMESRSSDIKLAEIDTVNQTFGAEYPLNEFGTVLNGTGNYDLIITKDTGLFGYDIETRETEMIVNWIKSGIDSSAVDTDMGINVLPDGRVFCIIYDYDNSSNMEINLLSEIPPEEVPDKGLVKLYTLNLDRDVRRQITEFNKSSTEYEIEMTDYLDQGTDFDSALIRMNNEMTAGNIPDILIIRGSIPVDSYIAKGLLVDLYEFMDRDEGFDRGDYLQNVFKAYERDGKLFEAAPLFDISTVAAKTSKVGERGGWTMDEFIDFANKNSSDNSGSGIFEPTYSTKRNMLSVFISYNLGSYMDMKTGECNFDGEDFIKLLEFCNRFPKESGVSKSDSNYWDKTSSGYRNDQILLNDVIINNFSAIKVLEQGQFGESVTFKGYPSENSNGSAISSPFTIAVMSKAANPDGAWEFVKHFYSDKFQDIYSTKDSYYFPVKISSLDKQAEEAKKKETYTDINGNIVEIENLYWIGGSNISLDVNTDEDNIKVMNFLKSVNTVRRYDSYVYNIVTEEAAAYFEGQKSVQEVADIIQNRVSNYIAENR